MKPYHIPERKNTHHESTYYCNDCYIEKCPAHGSAPNIQHEGIKHDQDKPRPELIAPEMIEALSLVLTYGAKKYADRNWEKGMSWSRPFGALMRHMWAWWKGENKDPETGFSHLAHAACCLMFLITYETRKPSFDDRPHGSSL